MNTQCTRIDRKPRPARTILGGALLGCCLAYGAAAWAAQSAPAAAPAAPAAAPQTSTKAGVADVYGSVSNVSTGDLLQGAQVEIPALGRAATVDHTGRYLFIDVPAGTHELVASYTGLDSVKHKVTVVPGQKIIHNFDLGSDVYVLEPVRVSGEKEGMAAAITAQRNAENVKNVVSMDAYGNLPNLNATELAIRLPGVAFGNPGDEVVEVVSVRGMGAGMTTITIDGGLMSSFSAMNRQTRMTAFTGAMFEQLEVIKGHTPDKGADSLGGTVNFRTRSPLSMKEKRRINYNISARTAPPFTEQIPMREEHRSHMLANISYVEKFAPFGADEEKLAVSVNLFYSENAFGYFQTTRDFQETTNQPAYLWSYATRDNYNNRKQGSVNTKFDFRLSQNTLLKLNFIVNDAPEPLRQQHQTRAYVTTSNAQLVVPNATTTSVVPGFTDKITQIRPVSSSAIDVLHTMINRNQRLRHIDIAGEHDFERISVDWAAQYSRTKYHYLGKEGALTNRASSVGWVIDRTLDDLYPQFIQSGGKDFTDPNSYRPTSNGLTTTAGETNQHLVKDVRGNVKYLLPLTSAQIYLKTGGQVRQQTVNDWANRRRWSYIGTTALPTDPTIVLTDHIKNNRKIPVWDTGEYLDNGQVIDPSLWREDLYYHYQTKYTNTREVEETVSAAYIMAQGKIGANGFLTGVRGEKTDTDSWGWVRARKGSTTAEQTADPLGAATRDYAGTRRDLHGSYTKYFPSFHYYRNFTKNLKARVAYSTSFGRPSMNNLLPNESIDETNQRLTVNNPDLVPQMATNYDFTLEYYFEPSGNLSIGWFHKTIKDYIVTGQIVGSIPDGNDNGYNGEYAGWTKLTSLNAGTAYAQGWEFSYFQQLRMLPGVLKRLSLSANMTIINTHGEFGDGVLRQNGDVPGFIPRTGNVSLSWNYKKFGTRVLYNYTSRNLRDYSASLSRRRYMNARDMVNLGFTYQVRSDLTLQMDIANLFDAPQRYYRYIDSQMETYIRQGTTISVGLQGRF